MPSGAEGQRFQAGPSSFRKLFMAVGVSVAPGLDERNLTSCPSLLLLLQPIGGAWLGPRFLAG